MFKLNDFMASISTRGVLKSTRYTVSFTPPAYVRSIAGLVGPETLSIRCDTVQFPGASLTTIDGPPRYGYGPIESIPYNISMDDITCSFIVDAGSEIHRFFYSWVSTIVNFQAKGGMSLSAASGAGTGFAAYEVGYKDNYTTDLIISVYDSTDKKVMEAKAYRAYPKLLPSVDLNWGATDEIVKLVIPFTYVDFDVNYFPLQP